MDYTDLAGDTHVAELNTRTGALHTILFVDQPYANHNGGALAFGPDGKLYVGMGDGGSEGDPQGNGQNPRSALGKILRLDVAQPGSPPEIYALGLRNPWRFAFDSATDDLWIGDVGQNRYEEVDRLRAGEPPGANLGWNLMEGNVRYDQDGGLPAGLVAPVAVYSHADGCSITGGFVYRGHDLPQLRGRYVFGDFCSGTIWSMRASGGRLHPARRAGRGGAVLVRRGHERRAVRGVAGRHRSQIRPRIVTACDKGDGARHDLIAGCSLAIRPLHASWGVHRLGVWERSVPDRVVVEVGLGHAEQVSQLVQQRVMDNSPKMVPVDGDPVDRQAVEGDLGGAVVLGEHSKRTRLVETLVFDRYGDVVGGDRRLDPAGKRVEFALRQRRELILRTHNRRGPFLHHTRVLRPPLAGTRRSPALENRIALPQYWDARAPAASVRT